MICFSFDILVNQEYEQEEIKHQDASAAGHVKGHPGFIVLRENKISGYGSYRRKYSQNGKDTY
jgi:hypothetical protein